MRLLTLEWYPSAGPGGIARRPGCPALNRQAVRGRPGSPEPFRPRLRRPGACRGMWATASADEVAARSDGRGGHRLGPPVLAGERLHVLDGHRLDPLHHLVHREQLRARQHGPPDPVHARAAVLSARRPFRWSLARRSSTGGIGASPIPRSLRPHDLAGRGEVVLARAQVDAHLPPCPRTPRCRSPPSRRGRASRAPPGRAGCSSSRRAPCRAPTARGGGDRSRQLGGPSCRCCWWAGSSFTSRVGGPGRAASKGPRPEADDRPRQRAGQYQPPRPCWEPCSGGRGRRAPRGWGAPDEPRPCR